MVTLLAWLPAGRAASCTPSSSASCEATRVQVEEELCSSLHRTPHRKGNRRLDGSSTLPLLAAKVLVQAALLPSLSEALKGFCNRRQQAGSSTGEALLPQTPSNRQASKAGFPPLWVLAGLTFLEGTRRQFSRLASKEAAERASSSTPFVSCRLPMDGPSKLGPIVVRSSSVLRSRPVGAARRASSSLSLRGGSFASPTPPSNRSGG